MNYKQKDIEKPLLENQSKENVANESNLILKNTNDPNFKPEEKVIDNKNDCNKKEEMFIKEIEIDIKAKGFKDSQPIRLSNTPARDSVSSTMEEGFGLSDLMFWIQSFREEFEGRSKEYSGSFQMILMMFFVTLQQQFKPQIFRINDIELLFWLTLIMFFMNFMLLRSRNQVPSPLKQREQKNAQLSGFFLILSLIAYNYSMRVFDKKWTEFFFVNAWINVFIWEKKQNNERIWTNPTELIAIILTLIGTQYLILPNFSYFIYQSSFWSLFKQGIFILLSTICLALFVINLKLIGKDQEQSIIHVLSSSVLMCIPFFFPTEEFAIPGFVEWLALAILGIGLTFWLNFLIRSMQICTRAFVALQSINLNLVIGLLIKAIFLQYSILIDEMLGLISLFIAWLFLVVPLKAEVIKILISSSAKKKSQLEKAKKNNFSNEIELKKEETSKNTQHPTKPLKKIKKLLRKYSAERKTAIDLPNLEGFGNREYKSLK